MNFFGTRREAVGKTQRQIADELKITTGAVSSWERSKTTPEPRYWVQLAVSLKTTPKRIGEAVAELAEAAGAK